MENVTRSGCKLKAEDSNNSKKGQLSGKGSTTSGSTNTETSGLRRSARETPSKKQRASSPPSTRKSERIEKRTPPTPPINRSSVRVVKLRMPSPLVRPERVENQPSSSSSGSKKSEKGLKLLIRKGKKGSDGEKGKQPIVNGGESVKNEEVDHTYVRVSSRKKRLDARSYRALLTKPKARKAQEPDPIQKLKGHDEKDPDKKKPSSSKEVEAGAEVCVKIGEELGGEELEIGCERACEGLSSGSKRSTRGRPSNHKEVEISYFTRKHKNRVDEAHASDSGLSSAVSKCSDDSMQSSPVVLAKEVTADAGIHLGCPTAQALHNTELMDSTSEGRSVSHNHNVKKGCNVGPSKRKRNVEDLESDTSFTTANEKLCTSVDTFSSFPSENKSDSVELWVDCSKRQRLDSDSQKDVCFCNSERTHTSCNTSSPKKVCKTETELKSLQNGGLPVTLQKNGNEEDMVHIDDARGKANVGNSDLLAKLPRKIVLEEADLSVIADSGNLLHQDGGKVRAIDGAGPAEECAKVDGERCPPDTQMEFDDKTCVICKHGGDILCCTGNGCKRGYHLSCLEPPLKFFPPGSWHCFVCVKKKMKLGVHAVSGGIESVCNTREEEVSDGKGMQKQKEYFVKFKGIAHVHNHWIPEKQLLVEAPMLAKFKKNKAPLWKPEWAKPHCLLHKRMLISPKQHDQCLTVDPDDTSNCHHEWLVKWSGLDYEHCTWELENTPFLRSPEAMVLIKEYENRLLKAIQASDPFREDKVRDDSFIKLCKLPGNAPSGLDNDHLSYVNKLRENWQKRHNVIVVEDQERILKTILFILSIESDICRPLLVISPASSFSAWEAEFSRVAPSLNVVAYIGKRCVRKNIRALEFYEESGCIMFQVLLSTPDAVVEDLESLECIGWEMIIADEGQHSRVLKHFEKIKILTTDFKLLLVNGQIKDCITEYLNLLSFIDYGGDKNDDANLNNDSIDSIGLLKERFTRFIACERKSESKFIEYWVPVRLSNVQLEHYCATLLSNSLTLRSCSKSDPVGALRNILISSRKCCDHPYLLDESLQPLLTKDLPEIEYLNVGVDASGKLQVLGKILSEIKKRCLRALVIFQLIGGSGRNSIGDILDDFLRQRFGPDSYERVDSGLVTAKKQAALNMFNNKERGRFVFLIENRACLPSIKLASVDMVVLFDSDWNPLNDLRALQKITIDSQHEQLKVFRLYSSCTVEEKVLILAKQDRTLDSNIQNINCGTSHMLLNWGASYLFKKLDEFHNGCTQSQCISTEQSFLADVVQEILSLLQSDAENNNTRDFSLILKAQQNGGTYSKSISLLGEMEMQLKDEEVPYIFWANLLEGRQPRWRYSSGPSPRSRKKVKYFDETPKRPQVVETDECTRKKKKVGSNIADPNSSSPWIQDKRNVPRTDMEGDGASDTAAVNIANEISDQPKVHGNESEETRALQKNLHLSLIPEVSKLCETLQLPDGVKIMAEKLLEYIMNYFHVGNQSSTTLQALLLSLCWSAASLLKHKIDHRESFSLAKQHLNFECTEEETQPMYKKLRTLKRKFCHAENVNFSSSGSPAPETKEAQKQPSQARHSIPTAFVQEELEEGEIRMSAQSISCFNQQDSTKQGQASDSEKAQESPSNESGKAITQVKRFYSERMQRIGARQMKEYNALNKKMEEAKVWLEREHKIESALIRTLHNQMSVRLEKLKVVDQNFEKKMEEFKLHKETEHKKLQDMQQEERDEEKRLKSQWLKEAKRGSSVDPYVMLPLPDSAASMEGFDEDEICHEKGVVPTFTGTSVQTLEPTGITMEVPGEAAHAEISNIVSDEVEVNVSGTELQTTVIGFREVNNENNSRLDCDYSGSPSLEHNVTDSPLVEQHVALAPDFAVSSVQSGEMGECNTGLDSCENGVTPSLEQNQRGSPFVEQHAAPAEDGGISSIQSDQVDENNTRVDCLENRDLSSAKAQLDSLSQQPHGYHQASPVQEPQSVAMNSGEVDVENNTRLAYDDGGSPSAVQSRIDPAFVQQHIAPVRDSQVSLAQPLTIQSSQVNPVTTSVDRLESEGLYSSVQPQIDSPLAQLPQHCLASSLQEPQSVAMSSGEVNDERNARVGNDNGVSPLQTQLDPPLVQQHIAPVQDSQVLLSQTPIVEQPQPSLQLSEVRTQPPPEDRLRRTSTQFMEDASHLPAPAQNLLSNHSISQPEAQLQLHPPTDMFVSGAGTRLSDARGVSTVAESSLQLPTVSATSRMPLQFCTDPLQNELARLRKEEDQTSKMHEDLKMRLNTECEKELEDIRRKYKALLQDAEVSLVQKKKELETHYSNIYMNRILAEAFRLKCSDSRAGVSASPQGGPSVFMQQLSQLSSQQHFQRSAPPTGPPSTLPAAPPVQVVHNPSTLFSSTPARPHFNSLISPTSNRQVGSEIRTPAPHLQPFRPTLSTSAATQSPCLTPAQPSHSNPTGGSTFPQITPRPLMYASVPISRAHHVDGTNGCPVPHNPSPSAFDLLMDVNNHSSANPSNLLSRMQAAIGPGFESCNLSEPAMTGSLRGPAAQTVPATDIVCLSDDD